MPGMPGTGLGGIFYALLIFWITVREVWLAARSASGRARWLKIGEFLGILAGIIAVFWFVGWAIKFVATELLRGSSAPMPGAITAQNKAIEALVPTVALLPLVILLLLLVGVHVARLVIGENRRSPTQQPTPAGLIEMDAAPQA